MEGFRVSKKIHPAPLAKVVCRFLLSTALAVAALVAIPSTAYAATYTVSYDANASEINVGITTGSVPASTTGLALGTLVTAEAQGSLLRQGYTFNGWNTSSAGTGITYAAGTGTFNISADTTLYALWSVPLSARMIGNGGNVITISGSPTTECKGNIRGITSSGSSIYYRTVGYDGYICEASLTGAFIALHTIGNISTGSAMPSGEAEALSYSHGCIFLRPDRGYNAGTSTTLYCVATSNWALSTINTPSGKNLYMGSGWGYGNMIDFPDGRIGAVSYPNMGVGTSGLTCPTNWYCKVLRLYTPSGTGASLTLTFSEDFVLADPQSGWPGDEHGIATDGTYLYEIRHASGYKVWALQSGQISYLAFNGDTSSGACNGNPQITNGLCPIYQPVTTGTNWPTSGYNVTFIGHNHATGRYIMGNYAGNQFWISDSVAAPAGPGSGTTRTLIIDASSSTYFNCHRVCR